MYQELYNFSEFLDFHVNDGGILQSGLIKLLTIFVKVNNLHFVLPHSEKANLVQIHLLAPFPIPQN